VSTSRDYTEIPGLEYFYLEEDSYWRDDLGLEVVYEEALKEFLFQLATPELADPLTLEVATRWETTLEGSPQA